MKAKPRVERSRLRQQPHDVLARDDECDDESSEGGGDTSCRDAQTAIFLRLQARGLAAADFLVVRYAGFLWRGLDGLVRRDGRRVFDMRRIAGMRCSIGLRPRWVAGWLGQFRWWSGCFRRRRVDSRLPFVG